MKRLLITFSILMSFAQLSWSSPQIFAAKDTLIDPAAEWVVVSYSFSGVSFYTWYKFADEDTLIDGKTYWPILWRGNEFQDWQEQEVYARQEESKVYKKYANHSEQLMFDMDWEIGDSISYTGEFTTFVSAIDSVELTDGTYRKRWHLSCDGEESYADVVEGIGGVNSVGFLDFNQHCYPDVGTWLSCYFYDGELIYANPDFEVCASLPKTIDYGKVWRRWSDLLASPSFVFEYKFNADTLINGKKYLRLFTKNDTGWEATHLFYREDESNKVYLYYQDQDVLIHDYRLEVGDTISMPNYDDVSDPSLNCTWEVFQKDTITLLNGEERLRLQLRNYGDPFISIVDEWIQGIGSTYRHVLSIYGCDLVEWPDQELQCFLENDEVLYTNSNELGCYYTSTDELVINQIALSPNPTQYDFVYINGIQGPFSYEVYNMHGQLIKSGMSENGQVEGLEHGLNLIYLHSDNAKRVLRALRP